MGCADQWFIGTNASDVTYGWTDRFSNFSDCLTLKMETLRSFETWEITRSRPQRDSPETFNLPLAIYCKDCKLEVQQGSPLLVPRLSSFGGCSLPALTTLSQTASFGSGAEVRVERQKVRGGIL